jgi:Na+-transporting NADH:ubiquinone oxidoreductase subunit C
MGLIFDHQGETPGLGAEINTDWFQAPFVGKTLFNDAGEFVSIEVVKGGADPSNPHQVDAISGGTITSKGLEDMLKDCLTGYVAHFKELATN